MSEWIEIQWSASSIDEARRISRFLVQEKLAAFVQIVPWIETITLSEGKLDTTQESKVLIRTEKELFFRISELIRKNAAEKDPDIVCLKPNLPPKS